LSYPQFINQLGLIKPLREVFGNLDSNITSTLNCLMRYSDAISKNLKIITDISDRFDI